MASVEDKVASAILGTIRARRKMPHAPRPQSEASEVRAKLREATFADFDGVMALRRTVGWSPDSLENWERLWRHNPAWSKMQFTPPIGWVLEAQGRVVGYLGNIPLIYHYDGRTLTAVSGSGMVVEPTYRASTLSMNAAFYGQKSADLFLTTTAIGAVGRIARAFKCDSLPQADYDSLLFWVLQPGPFAKMVMKKLEVRPSLAGMGSMITSLAARADRVLRRRRPAGASSGLEIKEITVEEIGDEFGCLWREKLKETLRLLADRDPATMRWHFTIPGDAGLTHVLCCYKNARLLGYAVVRHEAPNEVGLKRSIIADMLAKDDDPAALTSLWVAAYDRAKQAGSHTFEVLGFPPAIRQICSSWHPYVRKYPACPFYYKAANTDLHQTLADGNLWYASPFDGDTTLWGFGS